MSQLLIFKGKLSDYVSPTVAATLSCQSMVSIQPADLNDGQGDINKSQLPQPLQMTTPPPITSQNHNLPTKKSAFGQNDELRKEKADADEQEQLQQQSQAAAKTTITNPLMARIQRDLNSPSANVRLRALKAIRSPAKSTYDVSNNDKSVSTEERQPVAKSPPSLREILKDIVVYVEVRTEEEDRSSGVKKVIGAMGARVNDSLKRDTTHVIFKDGRLSTYRKAKSLGIPIVSILWIEACKNKRRICDPKDYQISNLERYENPQLYGKMKRYKFIQPVAKDKRRRVRKGIEPTSPKGNNSQTENGCFFKILDKSVAKTGNSIVVTPIRTNVAEDLPATVLVNRFHSNQYTPIAASVGMTKSMGKNLIETTTPTLVTTQCRSSIDTTNIAKHRTALDSNGQLSSMSQMTPQPSHQLFDAHAANKQRRRTLLPLSNTINEHSNDKLTSSMSRQNELSSLYESRRLGGGFVVSGSARRQTSFTGKSMESSAADFQYENVKAGVTERSEQSTARRRRTLFTPQTILECSRVNGINATASIRPISTTTEATTEPSNDETTVETTAVLPTPNYHASEDINIASAAPLSSARHSCRRGTLFDLSMDIISHQVQHINAKSRQSLAMTPSASTTITAQESQYTNNKNEQGNDCNMTQPGAGNLHERQMVQMDAPKKSASTLEKEKRKLFRPLELSHEHSSPLSPSRDSTTSSNSNTPNKQTTLKRRRTLMPTVVNAIVVDAAPNLQSTSTSRQPSKGSLLSRRSSLDFEPPPSNMHVERTKSKSKHTPPPPLLAAPVASTVSSTTLKENSLCVQNGSLKSVSSGKPRRRLPFLAFTNMRSEQVVVINEAVKKFGGFIVERIVGPNTTHMVTLEARRTMNILRGLIRGLWILDYTWITDSLKASHWLPEEQYEMRDFSRAVEICRAERQAFGANYKCELFADLGAFFISSRCHNMPARDLKELIRMCGGTVVDQRKNAKYILSSSTRAADDKIYVTPLWILDSITKMQLLRIQKYTSSTTPAKYTPSSTRNMPTVVDVVKNSSG